MINCPICKSEKKQLVYSSPSYDLSGVFFKIEISQCLDCSFVFQTSAYNENYEKLSSIYYKNYEPYTKLKKKSKIVNLFEYEEIKNKILPYIDKEDKCSILEIGSGDGSLLFYLKEEIPNLDVIGVEPSNGDFLVETINDFFSSELFKNKKFNFVIMRHVLEHIKYPEEFLKDLEKNLCSDSVLYIEVPSLSNNLKNLNEDFVFEHVSYFDTNSLKRLFKNYKDISIDSHNHISMLFQRSSSSKLSLEKNSNIINKFENYTFMKKSLLENFYKKVQSINNLCFYGLGHYFKIIFYELYTEIKEMDIEIFLCDSSYEDGEIEVDSKILKIINFDYMVNCDLIVLSAGDFYTRKKMKKQVFDSKSSETFVLEPWRSFSS